MSKKSKINWNGSTIIEVLIATTIVAFALTGLAALMTNNVKNSAEADYREAAAGIAQDTMEQIRQRKNTMAWSAFGTTPYASTNCSDSPLSRYKTTFYIRCTPATKPPTPANEYTIAVKVCWPGDCGTTDMSTSAVQRFYNY